MVFYNLAGQCFVKSRLENKNILTTGETSYIKRYFDYYYTEAAEVDHYGNDLTSGITGVTRETCKRLCDANIDCMLGGFEPSTGVCNLKSSTQNTASNAAWDSLYKNWACPVLDLDGGASLTC